MGEDQALQWARTRVAIKYGIEEGLLRAQRVAEEDGVMAVELVDDSGIRYRLRMRGVGPGVRIVECGRVFPE